jgi:hypothetical protein
MSQVLIGKVVLMSQVTYSLDHEIVSLSGIKILLWGHQSSYRNRVITKVSFRYFRRCFLGCMNQELDLSIHVIERNSNTTHNDPILSSQAVGGGHHHLAPVYCCHQEIVVASFSSCKPNQCRNLPVIYLQSSWRSKKHYRIFIDMFPLLTVCLNTLRCDVADLVCVANIGMPNRHAE